MIALGRDWDAKASLKGVKWIRYNRRNGLRDNPRRSDARSDARKKDVANRVGAAWTIDQDSLGVAPTTSETGAKPLHSFITERVREPNCGSIDIGSAWNTHHIDS